MNTKKTYIIDLDDTLLIYPDSHLEPEKRGAQERYQNAAPNSEEIKICNKLYREGNYIIIYSGRGWHQYEITKKQLKLYGIKHNELILGKPCGIWVDSDFKTSLKMVKSNNNDVEKLRIEWQEELYQLNGMEPPRYIEAINKATRIISSLLRYIKD